MPLQKLQFKPGINREGTNYANEGGWYDSNNVRFRSGSAEKIGGWSRLSNNQYIGTARALWNWADLNGNNLLGIGTNKKYYIEQGGNFNDITPFIYAPTVASGAITITATNGSSTLTIFDGAYTPNVGDYLVISGAVSLGGNITAAVLNQEYREVTSISGTRYTISADSPTTGAPVLANASDIGTGGAGIIISYEVPIGLDTYTVGTGWGAGPYGGTLGVTSSLVANPFASTSGSPNVVVTKASHGFTTESYVLFAGATAFGGFTTTQINDTYSITVLTVNTFQVTFSSNATSTVAAGGGASVTLTTQPSGWGTSNSSSSGIGQQLRLWSNDNFGQDLTIAPRGGNIYYWQASLGASTRGSLLNTLSTAAGYSGAYVPTKTNQIITSSIQKFVIAFGSNPYFSGNPATTFNPMLVRWSDQINPYQWVPDITNQSGEFALTSGSTIVSARATRQEILIWTDAAIYSMQYLGAPYVWGFNILMDNITIMSPNAAITVNNVTYWMGVEKFYTYSGRVETLPCTLRQYIFDDLNKDQAYQVFAGANEGYNEVWWFYVSNSSKGTTIDRYVIYNYLDRVWYYGNMARTAWLDSSIRQYPMAADYNNRILYHESSVDDNAGESSVPINAYVQSSDFDIGDGHNFGFVWRILPDVNFNGSNVNDPVVTMTVKPRQNSGTQYGVADIPSVVSGDNYTTQNTYNVQTFTGQVYTRLRGRQLSFRIESNSLGCQWQLGTPRIDIRSDGRR
jgi:hypothetical protein